MSKRTKRHIGIDWAYKPSWWKRVLVWLGIKKRDWDYSCMVIGRIDKKGVIHVEDVRYLK